MIAGLPIAAALWDQLLGEPAARVHPVVWLGRLIGRIYRLAPQRGPLRQGMFGLAASTGVIALAVALGLLVQRLSPAWLAMAVELFLLSSSFAQRALANAAHVVQRALERGDLAAARAHMSWLCSRDPNELDAQALCSATISSVAENASDSIVAPLFWYGTLGLPALLAFRAINTLDAMVGYRGHYEYLGKVPARLDDLANLIPARMTALFFLMTACARGEPVRRGLRMWRRDGRRTESPNAGIPMATMAGLLGVQLDKPGHYTLGDAHQPLSPARIHAAVGYLWGVTALSVLWASGMRALPWGWVWSWAC